MRSETLQFCRPRLSSSCPDMVLWGGDTWWPLGGLTKCTPTQQHLNSGLFLLPHILFCPFGNLSLLFSISSISLLVFTAKVPKSDHTIQCFRTYSVLSWTHQLHKVQRIFFFLMYSRGVQILKCSEDLRHHQHRNCHLGPCTGAAVFGHRCFSGTLGKKHLRRASVATGGARAKARTDWRVCFLS